MATRIMSREEAEQLLASVEEGRLATVGVDGQPYITPLNHLFADGRLYFHSRTSGRKLANLAANPRACFEVTDGVELELRPERVCGCSTHYRSALAFGRVRLLEDESQKAELLNRLVARFVGDQAFQPVDAARAASCAVLEMTIEELSGKVNFKRQDGV